ncbi:MAG TPA: TonB-dependent receptor plug domain-containing protein [Chitinophagaceae bacterium]|nr:TonB-dependent receptor plug domain-containing protein [Chitinophagaceae bacterium]
MKLNSLFPLSLLFSVTCIAQQEGTDTTKTLDEVIVKAFEQQRPLSKIPVSLSVLSTSIGDHFNKTSLVNGLNLVAGVRMEERSPGSYRVNIRGSSLRSPFGVRNIKIYWNDIPVTDPGGNTYFNQFAWNNFSSIEIFKGPAGSMYGAGTGGLILLHSLEGEWQPGASGEYNGGSYGLHNIFFSGRFGKKENKNQLSYAHNQTDGYRVQTKMHKDNIAWISQMKRERYELTASFLYTAMYYQTPGALTLAEFNTDPRAARPAGGAFPSAVNAKAAIYQKNLLAGFSNLIRLSTHLKNTTTVYGAFAQIKNPAIRNYERRNEPSFGGRTVFSFNKKRKTADWIFVAGAEFQQGYFNTQVAKNRNGEPDTLQTNDDINNRTYSFFTQADVIIKSKWFITGGISISRAKLEFTRLSSYPVIKQARTYKNEVAPKLSLMRSFNKFQWLATVSRGFSPPAIAEVLPSTGVISTDLEAEEGWNYETTLRAFLFRSRLKLELTGFYFRLNNALVQRRDLSGADFFVNAGDTKQKGIEFHADYKQYLGASFFRQLTIRSDLSVNHFRYGSFIKGSDNFSGKKIPSVPLSVLTLLADLGLANGIYLNANYYGASSIYLNDANTAKAEPYHLLGCQLGWKKKPKGPFRLNIYVGADNLLDETYSLGNDINAAANRFYNAAPTRNYYAGISFQFLIEVKQ